MLEFENAPFPRFFHAKRTGKIPCLEQPEEEVNKKMQPLLGRIQPGNRIAIAAGSRGICNYDRIVKAVVDTVKSAGAHPFIIPAMGDHGGATAEGQTEVLASCGITEDRMGAPILSSMETVVLGQTAEGTPVPFDKNASGMDGIILVNRVKPHTDFHANIESGVIKQMVVGLGKQQGASAIHRHSVYGLTNRIPKAAQIILDAMPILMGVAILENAQNQTARIEVLASEDFLAREPALLKEAKSLMPSLPVHDLDVLVLLEMGQNISGTGIDPNIVGRYLIRDMADQSPHIYRIVCLDLTEESHHNAIGVGIADIISKRLYDKIDKEPTYVNTITSGFLERGFIPIVADNDRQAISTALHCCNRFVTPENARVIIAKNTSDLQNLIVSAPLLTQLRSVHNLIVLEDEVFLDWDPQGNLKPLADIF